MCIVSNHSSDIRLIVSVDGLPLTKSGKKDFWPILCRVHYKLDIYKPFAVAVYCGSSKPKYFDLFIQELNDLQGDGIFLHGKHFNVSFMCNIRLHGPTVKVQKAMVVIVHVKDA